VGSPLDFVSSDGFRKRLITRNLTPYAKAPSRPTLPINVEYVQSDTSVQDSPDQLIDEPSFANQLYPLNQYGNEGGYKQVPDPNALLNSKSNEGEYGVQDARIIDEALPESQKWKPLNTFSNGNQLPIDGAEFISSLDRPAGYSNRFNNQPYPQFNYSSYGPVSILLSPDPQGSNGLLSRDSFIAKLGAATLRDLFQKRIATQIVRQTVGRANAFNVRGGTDVLSIVTGRVPIIEPNYQITIPANPIIAATDFALRLAGSTIPISPIPGNYFDPNTSLIQPTTIQQMTNAFRKSGVGKFFNRLLGGGQTGSQIMYNNMGGGQKSRLFNNINYNRYKPSFDRTLFDRLAGALVGSTTNNANYYIGSLSSDPSRVFSPAGDIPVNSYGIEQQSPVYGPSELAQLYEGPSKDIRLGANGPIYSNGGGIEGGFTWVSKKYKGNAGKTVGINGEIVNQDEDFKPSSYNTTESTNREYTQGSILDDTQRIIDSQPQGGKRLQHVGNAIDQVSKVFNDGYKELTKGSRVYKYVGEIGQEVGTEYCRVFAKDVPYLQYNDLQKTDGVVTEGRRFSYSVLDKTYNLNIAPNKQEGGQDSSNLINGPGGSSTNAAYAKKYMFSLENLAWRTSSTAGFSVNDLPICERGPNGGRVMWFPPYGLTFSENSNANWKSNDFLGRPEPIYTYNNTSRTGTLQWKIVVDHPSVLNVIVNKVLAKETNKTRVDSILESFFAGCRKYDLYELAKKYYTINPNDLYQLQQAISSKELTRNQLQAVIANQQTGNNSPNGATNPTQGNVSTNPFEKYVNNALYFENDFPKKTGTLDYNTLYNQYISTTNITTYEKKSPSTAESTKNFFEKVVKPNKNKFDEMAKELIKELNQAESGSVTVVLNSSASAPATVAYNKELSSRRISSARRFFDGYSELKKYIDGSDPKKKLILQQEGQLGEQSQVKQYDEKGNEVAGKTVSCTDSDPQAVGGDVSVGSKEVYTTNAMACRRAFILRVEYKLNQPTNPPPPGNKQNPIGNVVPSTTRTPPPEDQLVPRDNITKRILRALLSECDYFETIKEETPMVYDNLKDKLKFFQPAFHSITPEGLNSRLTFLQQCMRPGQTIPTIKDSGEGFTSLEYNNATNTAFGSPPVLVLRVGDFYNTKIIPDGLQIAYENLDINPEGIGIQPMIATVTLNFKFVGGSGLKTSIDKLQNALTFNYYANTEMYDDRADVTDSSYKVIDADFLKEGLGTAPPSNNQANINGRDNDNTIGTITGIVLSGTTGQTEDTGTIQYTDFMTKALETTQTYFQNIVNKNKEIVRQYNNGVRQQWMTERNYVKGNLVTNIEDIPLFGKPNNVQQRFDSIFAKFIEEIDNNSDGFLQYINAGNNNFSPTFLSIVKTNYKNYVNNLKGSYQNAITGIIQSTVQQEQGLINVFARMNVITFNAESPKNTGTDGFQFNKGPVKIYNISGTTKVSSTPNGATDTFTELKNDIKKMGDDMVAFNTATTTTSKFVFTGDKKSYEGTLVFPISPNDGKQSGADKLTVDNVFFPFSTDSKFTSNNFRREYFVLAQTIIDETKYQDFKNKLIGPQFFQTAQVPVTSQRVFEKFFDEYWIKICRKLFKQENDITLQFIDNLEKGRLKNFVIYTPFTKKTRELTFTTASSASDSNKSAQKTLITQLGSTTNINTSTNTWNDKPNGGVPLEYVSKSKLN